MQTPVLPTPSTPLAKRLASRNSDPLDLFLDYTLEQGLELYPAQEEAILELYSGKNLILNTPTGSGKSLVATALHFKSAFEGRKSWYTSPIKALVNEKFLQLCREFGPDLVGMITGDASVNADAPIVCCTAEILSNDALRFGDRAAVDDVIMDEFHFFSDRERGVAWQIPLLSLPNARFLLMSATLGDTEPFEKRLTELNGLATPVVRSTHRPVPLEFNYADTPIHETIDKLIARGRAPIYLVHFTQASCADSAQNFLSIDFCTKAEKQAISAALEGTKFSSPYGKDLTRFLKHGIGLHHAGLLPRYRILVEKLARQGLLKIICGTDTLGVGVNVPIRTVLFTQLCKFNGEKTQILSVRDFHQISGRAGRKGFDDLGTVVAQAPEHVVENLQMERKAAGDPKKIKKIVKKKPPERGYLPWDKATFEKLISGQPEALVSRFQVTHGMLLNVLGRGEEGPRAMRGLISESFESEAQKKRHRKTAFQLFRSLHERGIVEIADRKVRLNIDLQQDFSLHQALSLYLVDTVKLLDPIHPDYALDLLTLVEAILENPDLILRRQLDRIKTEKMAEMKMEGIEYDQRIEELEKCEYPKPQREFIYGTFNEFAAKHPWVGQENIRPKSIAREMYETFQTFDEYVRDYQLQRAEGLLLRYLSEVYKTLAQTVPEADQSEEVQSMAVYFRQMVRAIDSSLLDEWERMRDPNYNPTTQADPAAPTPATSYDITRDRKSFLVQIRNQVFGLVRALATGDWAKAIEWTTEGGGDPWTEEAFEARAREFATDHSKVLTDPKARSPKLTHVAPSEDGRSWIIQQVLCDPEEHNDWALTLNLDLERSRTEQRPMMRLESIGPL